MIAPEELTGTVVVLPDTPDEERSFYEIACHGWAGEPVVADESPWAAWLLVAFPWLGAVVFGTAWIAGGSL